MTNGRLSDEVNQLRAELDALRAEVADIPHVRMRRAAREAEDQRARDVAMLALPREARNQALTQRPDLEHFLRGLGREVVSIVVEAPDEPTRALWASWLPPHWRDRVRLALTESIPHNVWLTLTSGELRLGRSDVTPEQVDALIAVGLGDAIKWTNVHTGERWIKQADYSPPSLDRTARTPMTSDQLAVARSVAPDLEAAISSGHVRVDDFTDDEDRDALLRKWEHEPASRLRYAEVKAPAW